MKRLIANEHRPVLPGEKGNRAAKEEIRRVYKWGLERSELAASWDWSGTPNNR